MNWIVFFIAGWLFFGLELGLRDGLQLGPTGAAPSFVLILMTTIALCAPKRTALWAALILGLTLDLTRAMPAADGLSVVHTAGPMGLGCAMGAYTVVTMRGVLYQRNPLTAPVVVFIGAFLAYLVAIAVFTMRSWYDPMIDFSAVSELGRAFFSSVFTALVALALAPILLWMTPLFMFDPSPTGWRRRASMRGVVSR